VEYSDEVIFALMKFHRDMKGYGWCSACRTYIEPRVDGGERARCQTCGSPAFRPPGMAKATETPEDPDAWRGQVVRKHIDDPEDDPGPFEPLQ